MAKCEVRVRVCRVKKTIRIVGAIMVVFVGFGLVSSVVVELS